MQKKQLTGEERGWWFVCSDNRIWLLNGKPVNGQAGEYGLKGEYAQQIGVLKNEPAWMIMKEMETDMQSVRQLLAYDEQLFYLASKALQLEYFYQTHQYCGQCGKPLVLSHMEWACICNSCQITFYPQIAPSIIVGIRRQNEILLAKHTGERGYIYTVLSGFVEVGETFEQAVIREVKEEVGIEVDNLRYLASQPWPFPSTLMVAYLADYKSGSITLDHNELSEANWYRFDKLPDALPMEGTVARKLIKETIRLCCAEEK